MPSDRPVKPHGTFTPASTIGRVLTGAGYRPALVRKGEELGGHRCSWSQHEGRVLVTHRCADSVPESALVGERTAMLELYAAELEVKGYSIVRRNDRFLYVNPEKGSAMPDPTPTLAEQIAALATLREFARSSTHNSLNTLSRETAEAINTLDDADLFADLDQERDAAEASKEN